MRIEELTASLAAEAAAKEVSRGPALSGKVTGPGWCAQQEQVLQVTGTKTVEAQEVFEDDTDDALEDAFDESLDLLEKALYLLDAILQKKYHLPEMLRIDVMNKRLDLYEFLTDYRQLDDEGPPIEGHVQSREEFIRQLEEDDEKNTRQ